MAFVSTDPQPLPAPPVGDSIRPLLEGAGAAATRNIEARRLLVERFRPDVTPALRTFVYHYALTIVPIGLSLAACALYPSGWIYVLGALATGFAQNGLGLLMHEGSHCFFHPDRRINDRLADLLVCLPIFNTVEGYRIPHLDHHRYAGTPRDPYTPFDLPKRV
jgi:fatty acid desaturase